MADVKFRQLTASARLLFQASRLSNEKTLLSIEFNYQKASYRIKRVLIHIEWSCS